MRIIAGSAGSFPLRVPKSLTRPTTDRVREAVFSSLGARVEGATALDLFAGSGSLGIEALSRGADSCVFVDAQPDATKVIKENLARANLPGGKVVSQNVFQWLRRLDEAGKFDLIFADPPYVRDNVSREDLTNLLRQETLAQSLGPDGCFILESNSRMELPDMPLWETAKNREYGTTRVSFLVPSA
ncbi:MAG: 16S rRNA (guanine(966)-N(2))-methyltransferase RsmD [Verrucomicrobiota bacterium]